MSAVKYHAEMAVGQDTIVTARGEIRWLIYIDALAETVVFRSSIWINYPN